MHGHRQQVVASLSAAIAALVNENAELFGGAMLGKKGKTTFVCHDCGNTWRVKL